MIVSPRQRLVAAALFFGGCSASAPAVGDWGYTLALREHGDVLDARLSLPAGELLQLTTASPALSFVENVTAQIDGREIALQSAAGAFALPASDAAREVRWRFLARRAGLRLDDIELAAWRGTAFVGSLGACLLRPRDDVPAHRIDLRVEPDATSFACALPASTTGWRGELADLAALSPCTFGGIARRPLRLDGGPAIEVVDLAPRPAGSAAAVDDLVREAARALTDYCGTFPVDRLLLLIAPGRRATITGGSARGLGGARIYVDVPRGAGPADLRHDWVMFHEMLHLALPSLPAHHHWLEEGSAVYLEPLLQARAGRVTETEVWRSMLEDYDQGLPAEGAGGLDDDPSWGRTYYGGAIFCLQADVEIRHRTGNARSLQDALRAVVAAGGNITTQWPIEEVLQLGDDATGTNVLTELYAARRHTAAPRELQSLWRRLGVRLDGDRVMFDDAAELAAIRRALVLGR